MPDEEAPEHKLGTAGGGKTAEKCAVRNILTGSFTVTSPSADNHGPVRVAGTYYLSYEDGTPITASELPAMYGICRMKNYRNRH